jgi:hypothetical protein
MPQRAGFLEFAVYSACDRVLDGLRVRDEAASRGEHVEDCITHLLLHPHARCGKPRESLANIIMLGVADGLLVSLAPETRWGTRDHHIQSMVSAWMDAAFGQVCRRAPTI